MVQYKMDLTSVLENMSNSYVFEAMKMSRVLDSVFQRGSRENISVLLLSRTLQTFSPLFTLFIRKTIVLSFLLSLSLTAKHSQISQCQFLISCVSP